MQALEGAEVASDTVEQSENAVMNRRVVAVDRGGPEVLSLVRGVAPRPEPHQVRVRILATGVSYADLLMREGVHPETPRGPITLGWDLIDMVDEVGPCASGFEVGSVVAALPVLGGYADYICLRPDQLVHVPPGLDPAEAVTMVLNYMTAYQMLHRSAEVEAGQTALIHGAAGGIGSALLQLGRLAGLRMYGTASACAHRMVAELGCTPIDYKRVDFVEEIHRMTGGVDVVFDGIGGRHVWRSYRALRRGGTVIEYGLTSSLTAGRLSGGTRHRFRGLGSALFYLLAARCIPDGKRIRAYSIQRRMWRHPDWFRQDLAALFSLLAERKIEPLIAARLPLSEARRAHELLASSVRGKIVLLCAEVEST